MDQKHDGKDWIGLLKQYEFEHALHGEIDADHEVQRKLRQIFSDRQESAAKRDPTLRVIPRFYPKKVNLPRSGTLGQQVKDGSKAFEERSSIEEKLDSAQSIITQIARNQFLQRKNEEMILEDDLHLLLETLQKNASKHAEIDEAHAFGDDRINYDDFGSVKEELPSRLRRFFSAENFMKFRRDDLGRISIQLFFQYACRQVSLFQTRIQLSMYDTVGDGFLREQDLENFIYEMIPSLDALSDLQENFYPFYVFTAVRKFFFFLDTKHSCKIAIKDLVTSPILHELLNLQNHGPDQSKPASESFNWFSGHNTLRVYSQYLELDIDHNGMLSRSEIAGYGTGSLTTALIDRVFEECQTYDGEMDYKTFLDFALAMETKKSPQSLAYFFRLLDINKQGYLDRFSINFFFREIAFRLRELDGGLNGDIVKVEDVTDEIFDMCKPSNPSKITIEDLIQCGVGDTIITMLTDLSGFWAYDNREHLIAEEARDERELEQYQ